MQIAVLCNYKLMPNRIGGMDYFYWEFDRDVKNLGHQIDWFFPNLENHGEYSALNIYSSENLSVESKFLEVIENGKFDYIFCHFLELCTPFFRKVKKQLPKCKIIAVDHNPRPLKGYSLKKRFEKRIKGFLFAKFIDLFVGVSEYTIKEIQKDFGTALKSKLLVIYNGILIDKIKIREQRNFANPKFLTACHLRYSKGIQDLILAVNILPDSIKSQLIIDIFGDGEYKNELLKLIHSYKLDSNFNFKGNSSNLGDVFQNYDYLIHPSHEETFGLVVVESMMANIPVITTETPGGNVLNIINNERNGFIFKPKDSLALKNILKDLIIGKKAIATDVSIEIRNKYNLDIMVNNYVNLLK
jgi:glycosyltransferase involved in cell wall biosynthesis